MPESLLLQFEAPQCLKPPRTTCFFFLFFRSNSLLCSPQCWKYRMAEVLINLSESAMMLINWSGSHTKPTIFMTVPIQAKVPEHSQLHEHDLPVISTPKVKAVMARPLLLLPFVPQFREQCASWQRCCWGEQHRSGCQKQQTKKKVIFYLFTLFSLKGFVTYEKVQRKR